MNITKHNYKINKPTKCKLSGSLDALLLLPLDDFGPGGAVHAEPCVGAAHLEPPPVEVLHHVAVTEGCPVPHAVCNHVMIVMRMLSVCCVTSDSAMSGSDNQWSVMRKLGPCKSETLALARRIHAMQCKVHWQYIDILRIQSLLLMFDTRRIVIL